MPRMSHLRFPLYRRSDGLAKAWRRPAQAGLIALVVGFAGGAACTGGEKSERGEEAGERAMDESGEGEAAAEAVDYDPAALPTAGFGGEDAGDVGIARVVETPGLDGYEFHFISEELAAPCADDARAGWIMFRTGSLDDATFSKALDERPDFDTHQAYWVSQPDEGEPTTVNPDWEIEFELSEVDAEAGRVRGEIELHFEEVAEHGDAWVAGEFDAIVCE